MNVLASLFRVVFSIIVLLALACYTQMAPTVTLGNFCTEIDSAQLLATLSGFNAVTVSLVLILLLGICSFTRVLEALWNVLFCAAVLMLLCLGLFMFGGSFIAFPLVLAHNDAVKQVCEAAMAYEVPIAITTLIFIAGWLCASACGRVAITAVVSYGLWFGLTAFFTYAVQLWANSATPSMPEALNMLQSTPWVIAAVPGAFFLIYALFMAFFETFIQPVSGKAKAKKDEEETKPTQEEEKKEPTPAKDEKPDTTAKTKAPLNTPAAAPAKKLKLATPATATPKAEVSEAEKAEDVAAAPETKPEEAKETPEKAPAKEEVPAPAAKDEAPEPKEETTKEETAQETDSAPEAETTPATETKADATQEQSAQ